jgi:adenylate kinase
MWGAAEMIVILLGAPGSGKGTQSKIMAEKYGFTHLATGDIFRGEIAAKTSLGEKAAEYVRTGKLVPDNLVTEMVAGKLDLSAGAKYLLDGFPRNVDQAQALDAFLAQQKTSISLVAYLNLPRAEALKRLSSRRVCGSCGEVFNVVTRPPAAEGKCDKCGADLVQREDDSQATASKRLMVFEDLTHPLVAYYKSEQLFYEVDASRSPAEVSAALSAVINEAAMAK